MLQNRVLLKDVVFQNLLIDVKQTSGNALISLGSSNGFVVTFNEKNVRSMGRNAAGVIGIRLRDDSHVVGLISSDDGNKIFSLSENGFGKISDISTYRVTNRGSKGVITQKSSEKSGQLLTIKTVRGDEDIILITNLGTTIRTTLTQIRDDVGRNTIGVKLIKLKEGEVVSSCLVLPSENEYESKESISEQNKEIEEKIEITDFDNHIDENEDSDNLEDENLE